MATPTFIHPGPVFVQSNATANRYITSGELSAEAGLGTITSLKSGSNITFQPSTITVTGSIGLSPDLTISSAVVTGNVLVSGNALFFAPVTASGFIGQTLQGGADSGGNLTLSSTSHATKGNILFGTSAYDEVNNRLGIGTAVPDYALDVNGTANATTFRSNSYTGISDVLMQTAGGQLLLRTGGGSRTVQIQDASNNSLLLAVNGTRGIAINKGSAPSGALEVVVIAATTIGQIVKAAASQTADLTQWQDSSGNVRSSVGATGNLMVSGTSLFYGTVTANAGVIRPYQILDTVVDLAGLGNSFTVSGAIPVGLCLGTLIHVQQTIVGCSGLNAGSVETPTLWAALAHSTLASGTKTTDTDILATSITRYASTDNVVLQASGGVFTSGKVNIRTCYVALS